MPPTKKPGKRSAEYQRRKARELAKAAAAVDGSDSEADEAESSQSASSKRALIKAEIEILKRRTSGDVTDADRDIDFAYRHMAVESVMPLDAPSVAAWGWYEMSLRDPDEFLKITQKREDAKAKQAGTITNQLMEDDKRQQFAILDRIEKQLTIDVKSMVKDLMDKFPREALRECRKYKEAWDSFLAEECK